MKDRTLIKVVPKTPKITYNSSIFALGSCFSVHISDRLATLKYNIAQNPCGITFNPSSLYTAIKRTISPESLLSSEMNSQHGLWSHPDFHGSFNQTDKEIYIEKATQSLNSAKKHLRSCNYVLLTIGTCHVFRSLKSGKIVNNCHKLPASGFTKELMEVSEVTELLAKARELIASFSENKSVQFILTVSPVRHLKNGLSEDKRSKATALLGIHKLTDQYDDCHYFPSYELMMDDLRDYRYYNDDLLHPRSMAIDYIFDLFQKTWLSQSEQDLRDAIRAINKRQTHRPLFPESSEHQVFTQKLQTDIDNLIKTYPEMAEKF